LFRSLSFSQLANLTLAAFLLLGIASTTYSVTSLRSLDSEAARGGPKAGSRYSVSVVPNPVKINESVTITASGFEPSQAVHVDISHYANCCGDFVYRADGSGNLVITMTQGGPSGTWKIVMKVADKRGRIQTAIDSSYTVVE